MGGVPVSATQLDGWWSPYVGYPTWWVVESLCRLPNLIVEGIIQPAWWVEYSPAWWTVSCVTVHLNGWITYVLYPLFWMLCQVFNCDVSFQILDLLGPKTDADLEKPVKQKVILCVWVCMCVYVCVCVCVCLCVCVCVCMLPLVNLLRGLWDSLLKPQRVPGQFQMIKASSLTLNSCCAEAKLL